MSEPLLNDPNKVPASAPLYQPDQHQQQHQQQQQYQQQGGQPYGQVPQQEGQYQQHGQYPPQQGQFPAQQAMDVPASHMAFYANFPVRQRCNTCGVDNISHIEEDPCGSIANWCLCLFLGACCVFCIDGCGCMNNKIHHCSNCGAVVGVKKAI